MASSLLRSITDFAFLATFTITASIMAYVQALSSSLQEKELDVYQAYQQIERARATLSRVREEIDERHAAWWEEAVATAAGVNVEPSMPRTCGRQQGRSNTPATSPKEYFRRTVSVPLLDELLGQFDTRFGPLQLKICKGMSLLPSIAALNSAQAKADIMNFAAANEEDLPHGYSLRTMDAEVDNWLNIATSSAAEQLPTSLVEAAEFAHNSLCRGVSILLLILATLPVTTCSCERSISSLRRLKTYLRSTMGADRLSGLALLHSHYSMPVNKDEVLKVFFRKNPRRAISSYDPLS